jgi:serine/threonine protein kinase
VGINQYKLTHYISTGAQGSTYRGFMVEDPFERIVLKIYKQPYPEKHFLAERFALLVTGRLRDDDYKNFITVQKEIPGTLLSKWYIDELETSKSTGIQPISKEDLFKQITQLLLGFHTKWGLAHNDVRLQNIIRKHDGSLELIDFGFTKVLATDDIVSYKKQIRLDFVQAQREYEFFFARLAVENAFRMPSRDKIPIVKKFVNMLWERGDQKQAHDVWKNYITRI